MFLATGIGAKRTEGYDGGVGKEEMRFEEMLNRHRGVEKAECKQKSFRRAQSKMGIHEERGLSEGEHFIRMGGVGQMQRVW